RSVSLPVTGTSGCLTHTATVDFTVASLAEFAVSANPTSVSVAVGSAGTSTITITPLNGFTGDVALVSDNAACSLTPTTVTGGSGTPTLSCTFATAGTVDVMVTGTSGSLSHSVTVTLTVTGQPDFAISATPTSVTTVVNSPAPSPIMITPVNSFPG